ncbi:MULTISPECIES: DUF5681 domain-containing protein [Afipia]|jgi:hypothetical protein|uniref:DUF5681 domain-containing protein n=1 Tax=Afipia massiliensis TaxID=211460 RepID=A0A840N717_9BRAD|nr:MULTISPECIES: DUF5681 domain-containing protein [Afipia]MAH72456.1 hypothetical protein [Afipia sp.]MBB5053561.1 hypothetical protein [Afipia massiliensis]OUX58539.1 MAG: hypothetical protein CBB64_24920 [Afipia sp. TMED4]HCX15921.1 hypothetical protein [Afipia sp.]
MSEQEEEKVGYRKPPAKTRFKPGQSGNLNGRPKGSVNLKTDLRSELSEKIRIREGERSLKVSKQRAMLKALVAKALKGDARAANVVLTLVGKLFEPEAVAERVPALTADDQAILERFLARRLAE